ncbi:MAG: hypothetical protein R3C49_18310 [Planctomycetaceae bacterium]
MKSVHRLTGESILNRDVCDWILRIWPGKPPFQNREKFFDTGSEIAGYG